jgi:Fic family protein
VLFYLNLKFEDILLLTREQLEIGEHIEEEEIGHIRSSSLPKNVRIGSHIPPHYSHVPIRLDFLVEKINEGLQNQKKLQDDAEYCKFLGESFQEFESIHPFADGNGRTGRLLANYIATYCGRPIIVFNAEMRERNRYYDAHESGQHMARFMARKVQEVIFGLKGLLLFKREDLSETKARYQSNDGKYEEIYDWTALQPLLEEKKESSAPTEKKDEPLVEYLSQDKESEDGISDSDKERTSQVQDREKGNPENFFNSKEEKISSVPAD